jgi:hypothetical protein
MMKRVCCLHCKAHETDAGQLSPASFIIIIISIDYENAYVKPEKTNAITTERINVKPLTGLVLSLIFSPDTYE